MWKFVFIVGLDNWKLYGEEDLIATRAQSVCYSVVNNVGLFVRSQSMQQQQQLALFMTRRLFGIFKSGLDGTDLLIWSQLNLVLWTLWGNTDNTIALAALTSCTQCYNLHTYNGWTMGHGGEMQSSHARLVAIRFSQSPTTNTPGLWARLLQMHNLCVCKCVFCIAIRRFIWNPGSACKST